MLPQKKCVVIKIGSASTVAGFNNTELPLCILSSSYMVDRAKEAAGTANSSEKYIFGTTEMLEAALTSNTPSSLEVLTTVDDSGIPYNWTVIELQIRHIYAHYLHCDPTEFPLVITAPALKNEVANKVLEKYFALAFDKLHVPVAQVLIEPLATALAMGKSTALVVDMGASGCNVTPVVDGTVVRAGAMRSRFAGNFLDYQVAKTIEQKSASASANEDTDIDMDAQSEATSLSAWMDAHTWIQDFKATMLQVSDKELQEVERFHRDQAEMYIKQQEQLQQFSTNNPAATLDEAARDSIRQSNPLAQKHNFYYKNTHRHKLPQTLTFQLRECNAVVEHIFDPSALSDKYSRDDGLAEIMGKAVKKTGATVSASGTNTLGSLGPSMKVQHQASGNGASSALANSASAPGGGSAGGSGASVAAGTTSSEQVYSNLLTNVIVTGATSLIPGMEQRIINELSVRFPQYKITTFASQVTLDRKIQGWTSSVAMANLPSWELAKWYTKEEFESELDATNKE